MSEKVLTSELSIASDIFLHEESPEYCRDSVDVTYPGADLGPYKLPSGYPIKAGGVPAAAAAVNVTQGLLMFPITVVHGETTKGCVLARGPAVINQDALPALDYAGATINKTTLATQLATLRMVMRRESPTQAEQTT